MFSIGDSFIYGSNCICKLTKVQKRCMNHETHLYYILKPVFDPQSTVYIPVGNKKLEAKMRRLLSADEVYTLIDEIPCKSALWIEEENQRKEYYTQVLASGDRTQLIGIIKAVFYHQQKLKARGKKLHLSDERFMKEAEKTLYDEFAYVLGISREEILPFLHQRIEQQTLEQEGGGGIVQM